MGKGGEGGVALAEEVIRLCEQPNDFTYAYELEGSIEDKLNEIVQKIYGGSRVVLTANAKKQAEADLLQAKEEGEVLKKQASEKTEQETEALKALAQGKEEEAVSAVIKALL